MNTNNLKLAEIFDQLAVQFKKDRYRSRAYRNAASEIRTYQGTILSGAEAQKKIKGIGKSIAAKIDEYLNTGTLSVINNRDPDEVEKEKTVLLFEKIHGVGPVTAEKWYLMGYRTLKDLSQLYSSMTDAQKMGYYYYNQLNTRIPRKEMDKLAKVINSALDKINVQHMICGSYRRGESSSGDIDCLIKGTDDINLTMVLSSLAQTGILVGQLALGSSKYMGICRLGDGYNARRIDLMIIAPESWPYATLYFTGSKMLNVMMRSKAIELGMSMNEYGMTDQNGKQYVVNTEKDIFDLLRMTYLKPTERSIGKK
jgi:DNA polymerase lambda